MTRPLDTTALLEMLESVRPGLEYADLPADERTAVDQTSAAIRAGDPAMFAAIAQLTNLSAMDAVAIPPEIPGTGDMRAPALALALRQAGPVYPPRTTPDNTDELAAAVRALPLPGGGERWTCRTATTAWLHARRSPHTRRAYFRDLTGWLTWLEQRHLDPRDARRGDVDTWITDLRTGDRPPAASTINRRLSTLSSWYAYLADHDLVVRNPVTAVDRPSVDRDFSPTVGLTVAEIRALLAAADAVVERRTAAGAGDRAAARRDRVLIGLLAGLGLRVSETTGLDLSDVRINQGHRTVVIRGKGGRTRELPVPTLLARHLEPLLAERRRDLARARVRQQFAPRIAAEQEQVRRRLDAGILPRRAVEAGMSLSDARYLVDIGGLYLAPSIPEWNAADRLIDAMSDPALEQRGERGLLFVTAGGRRLTQGYVFARVRRLAVIAGLNAAARISPHSLRHSAATAALDDGAPLRDVQDFLGHADPRTTRRYDRNRGSLDRSPAHRLGVLYAQ